MDINVVTLLEEQGLMGSWQWWPLEARTEISPGFAIGLGYEPGELLGNPHVISQLIHPDDVWMIMQLAKPLAPGAAPASVKLPVRMLHKGGHEVQVVCVARVMQVNEQGVPTHIIGAHTATSHQVDNLELQRDNHDHMSLVIDSSSAGIWTMNMLNGVIYWSPRLFEMLGLDPATWTPSFEAFLELVHPDDRALVYENEKRMHTNNDCPIYSARARMPDGQYRWFEHTAKALKNADGQIVRVAGSMRDVHERELMREQLTQHKFLLEKTGQIARVGGWYIALPGMEMSWTETAREICELPLDEHLPLTAAQQYYDPADWQLLMEKMQETIQFGTSHDLKTRLNLPSGRRIWVRIIAEAIRDAQGHITAVAGVVKDIDQHMQREMALTESLNLVSQQNKRLLNFAHIVSHNLRSHTGNLQLLAQLLETAGAEDERQQMLSMMQQTAQRLDETILELNHVLSLQSNVNLQRQLVNLPEVLAETMMLLQPEIEEHNAEIESDFSLLSQVNYLKAYLESILLNLLSNALKYRQPGRRPHVWVTTQFHPQTGQAQLLVQDNGRGIDLSLHGHKVFGMYKTFHGNADARGLGLYIVKTQVEALGGTIEVSSQPGRGTCFTITFADQPLPQRQSVKTESLAPEALLQPPQQIVQAY